MAFLSRVVLLYSALTMSAVLAAFVYNYDFIPYFSEQDKS
jgi:hypothetical protein